MGNMSCRDIGRRGQGFAQDMQVLSDISHICAHWSAASSRTCCGDTLQHSPRAAEWGSEFVFYLEDFCLAGVGVCVLFPRLLGVMLVLPLGPDLARTTLELGSTLTAFPRHIWKQTQYVIIPSHHLLQATSSIWVQTFCITSVWSTRQVGHLYLPLRVTVTMTTTPSSTAHYYCFTFLK